MKFLTWVYIFLFSLSVFAQSEDLSITSVGPVKPWASQLNQQIKLEVTLPKGFHAYKDQFKVLNLEPENFSASAVQISPETEFFDKYTQKKRVGFYERGVVTVVIEAPDGKVDPTTKLSFNLRYQICSEKVCHLPKSLPVRIPPSGQLTKAGENISAPIKKGFSLFESLDELLRSSLWLSFLSVFIAGILTSFTPCIFPMLPITISILGYHADKHSRLKNFSRALAYVLGIAFTYSTLGTVAALTGSLFGSMLTNKYVVGALVLLFFAMALSMWGAFELQSPSFIRNRFGHGKSHGLLGAFVMGLVAGIVASPCVGPVLISILTYVSTTKNAVLGFSLLFTFAMGLGLIFIVIGLFSSALKLLPKSGVWMDGIKFILGAGMWGAALYYAQLLMPQRFWIGLVAISFIALSAWKGAFKFGGKKYLRQSLMLAIFIFSSAVLIAACFKPEYIVGNFYQVDYQNKSVSEGWIPFSEGIIAQAEKDQKPVMIDFFAEWCGACHELANKTFSTDEFRDLAKNFVLVKFDATEDNEAVQQILKKYDVKGLPTVIFINRNGVIQQELTFTQFLTMDELRPKMQEALK